MESNALMHYGVKGMKWGVRRDRSKNGQSTSSRKKHVSNSDLAKKLADRTLDSDKKREKLSKSYEKRMSELDKKLRPNDDEWYRNKNDYNSGWSKKAKKYMKATEREWDKYSDADLKLFNARLEEEARIRKKVFFNDSVKNDVYAARDTRKKIESVYDETIGENSKFAKDAYKKYKSSVKDIDDAEYGFYHYEWRKGNADYDKAMSVYKAKTKSLTSEYDKQITDIGRKVFGEYADKKMNDGWSNTYADFGKYEVDEIIRFRSEYFK